MNSVPEREDDRELRDEYLRVWKEVLAEFLGWSPEKVERWSKRFSLMEDTDSIFYHYSALNFVSEILVPDQVRSWGHRAYYDFEAKLELAIQGGEPRCEMLHDFDWKTARRRVEALLATVGSSLEEVEKQIQRRMPDV